MFIIVIMLAQLFPVVFLFPSTILANNYAFLSLGDWGGAALEDPKYTKTVYAVSEQMETIATAVGAKFVLNTGDNFYWCGIQNTSDYQIVVDFEKPYAAAPLQVKWYSALGNHEYGYNVQAQIDYMKRNSNWHMPSRYYTERLQLTDGSYLTLLFLDTSPCVSDYRNSNPAYWDPCSTTYPTCAIGNGDDDFEGTCLFHENIVSQNCQTQYSWLQSTLSTIPADDWLVVVGHHPIDEVDVADMTTLIQKRGFSLYLNGHTHYLSQYKLDGGGAYITTGAGAMVATADQEHPITEAKLNGETITPEMRHAHRLHRNGNTPDHDSLLTYVDHTYSTVWSKKVAGFTAHTFSTDFTTLKTDFIDNTGTILHSFSVNKQGSIV